MKAIFFIVFIWTDGGSTPHFQQIDVNSASHCKIVYQQAIDDAAAFVEKSVNVQTFQASKLKCKVEA